MYGNFNFVFSIYRFHIHNVAKLGQMPLVSCWGPGTYLQLQAQTVLKQEQVTSQFPYEAPPGYPSLQTEGKHIIEMTHTAIESLEAKGRPIDYQTKNGIASNQTCSP